MDAAQACTAVGLGNHPAGDAYARRSAGCNADTIIASLLRGQITALEHVRGYGVASIREKLRAGLKGDLRVGKSRFHALQDADGVRGLAVVIAEQHRRLIRQRPDYEDALRALQRKDAIVLQKH